MTGKRSSEGPFLAADENLACERCGSELVMGTDRDGMCIETCADGCFSRPVRTRRHSCPECGYGPWTADTGCIQCGYGWVTRACDWDGVTAFWITPSAVKGREVPDPVSASST